MDLLTHDCQIWCTYVSEKSTNLRRKLISSVHYWNSYISLKLLVNGGNDERRFVEVCVNASKCDKIMCSIFKWFQVEQ